MVKNKRIVLRATFVLLLAAALFVPFCIIEDYSDPILMIVTIGNARLILISGFVALPITGVAILLGVVDLLANKRWTRLLVAFMTLLASVSLAIAMSETNTLLNDSGFSFSYHTGHFASGWIVFAVEIIVAIFYTFSFFADFTKKDSAVKEKLSKDKTNAGEKREKKPSKLKKVLINTGRVNSASYCGTLYGSFGNEPSNGYFVNLNKEGGLLVYGNNSDDLILTANDIEEVVFKEKTNWYSYGPGEAIDLVFEIKCKDGRTGTLKLPIIKAKRDEKIVREFRGENVNKALNAIGIQGYDYRYYQVIGVTNDNSPFNEFFVCLSDEELFSELRSAYGGGTINAPERLKGTKF